MESTAKSSLSITANVRQDPKTIRIGRFEVNRLDFGAMRITGGGNFLVNPAIPPTQRKYFSGL
jgi:hypothetical protein